MHWYGIRFQGLAEVSRVPRQNAKTPKRVQILQFFDLYIYTTHLHCLHFLLKPSIYAMGKNRVSDDLNHVADAPTITKKSKKSSPKPKPLPSFILMKIHDLIHERDKLLVNVAFTSYRIFDLFFSNVILQRIAEYINEYTTEYVSKTNKPFARKWYFISKKKLRAYITIYIYMKIHSQNKVSEY